MYQQSASKTLLSTVIEENNLKSKKTKIAPLKEKVFFLDLPQDSQTQDITTKLKLLGANVDDFFFPHMLLT